MGTKVLLEFEVYAQTAEMIHIFFTELADKFHLEVRAKKSSAITNFDIQWSDIVMSIRSMCCISSALAKICKKYGRFHIVVLDDNLFMHRRKDLFMRERQRHLKATLDNTSILLTSNLLLSEYACDRTNVRRSAHIDTVLKGSDIQEYIDRKIKNRKFKLVYYSNDGTNKYFLSILGEVFEKLDVNLQRNIVVEFIGMQKTDFKLGKCELIFTPHLSLSEFRNHLVEGEYDIGLAPLVGGDEFSKYKYFNKFMELSSAGILGIYSKCPPYTFIVQNRVNGLLCENNSEEWARTIEDALTDDKIRKNCVLNAQKQLKEEFSFEAVSSVLIEQIPEFISYGAPNVKISAMKFIKIQYYVFLILEKINSIYRTMKNSGIKGVIQRVKLYFLNFRQVASEYSKNIQ